MSESGYIKVSPAEVQDAGEAIRRIAGSLDDRLDVLRSELQKLVWTDQEARQTYQYYQDRWDKAVVDINTVLNEVGVKLGKAAQNYIDTEFNVKGLWG